ncbi:uncharacterized protein LOC120720390 isoform X3 [Simochromis diagramma]|uniref:uncharacterized protein LOC120720390 isoform X3 n=1 Tax=Simochromis diagramma TaxID=43689 RepID=UPI001A7F03DA|nr:uncharacterized protein LOC120720390 isoform X3 [Simochromis diagramma]
MFKNYSVTVCLRNILLQVGFGIVFLSFSLPLSPGRRPLWAPAFGLHTWEMVNTCVSLTGLYLREEVRLLFAGLLLDSYTLDLPLFLTEILVRERSERLVRRQERQKENDKKTTQKPTRKTKRYTTEAETTTTTMKDDSQDVSVSSRFIIVSVGLAALLITAVTVNTWSRTKAGYNTVKCEVTDTDTGRVQPFTFSPQPSGEETAEANTTKEPARKTESSTKSEPNTISNPSKSPISWYINGAIGLVALLITAMCFIIRKRMKGNKMQKNENPGLSSNPAETQTNQNSVDPEVSYVTISNT